MTRQQRGRWAVAAMFLANGFLMGAWVPQIPLLLPRHGIGESTVGLLILVLGLGALASMTFCGRLITRHGSRPVLRVFAGLAVPVLPLVILAPGLLTLALAMFLFGAMLGCMDVAMNANAVEVESRLGRAIMSSSHGFWSLGGFAGSALGGLLIAQWGPEAQALAVAAVLALTVAAAAPFLDAAPGAAKPAEMHSHRLLPRDPLIWAVGGLALLCMLAEGGIMDWAALYLMQQQGADVAQAGLGFACFAGAMAIMRFAGDGLRNRFGAVRTLRASTLIAAAGLLTAALAPSLWVALPAFALAGLGLANTVPIMFSAAGNHPGLSAGAALSTVTMIGYSGILIGPSGIGVVAEHAGFRWTYAALALALLLVTAFAPLARAADRPSDSA